MPKLTQNTLDKKFSCQYCDKPFRTRQGLSGHIQWKHKKGKINNGYEDKMKALMKRTKLWKTTASVRELDKKDNELGMNILWRWMLLLGYFDLIGIDLNDNDFKNYFIQNFRTEIKSS